jgi:hypothetical protein
MGRIKTLATETARWTAILLCGGCVAWMSLEMGRDLVRHWNELISLLTLFIWVSLASPFLAAMYYCFRREYRKLYLVLGVIGALVIYIELLLLPDQFGVNMFIDRRIHDSPYNLLIMPFVLLSIFIPIYAAAWFYRVCQRLAYRGVPGWKEQKTHATRWLIWLGLLCLLCPALMAMHLTFTRMTQSPTAISPDSLDNQIRWITGLSVIGVLLIFLGLVQRRPIPDESKKTP